MHGRTIALPLAVGDRPSVLPVSVIAFPVTLGTAEVTKDAPVIFFCFPFLLPYSEGLYCYDFLIFFLIKLLG